MVEMSSKATKTDNKKKTKSLLISLIIPCYNEEEVLEICHERVRSAIKPLKDYAFEIIYINDGSSDKTWTILKELTAKDKNVRALCLSRNFGKEAAMTAGLDHCRGDAAIILDSDLQDPPELIADMIKVWQEQGADVVYGQRTVREGETWFKKFTAWGFYQVINFISEADIPRNTGDFRLMNRRAINALLHLRERHRFMKGLFAWIGYKQVALHYNRQSRAAGKTKWNYLKLWNFALEGITGFSMTPLRMASLAGLIISLMAFAFAGYIFLRTLIFGRDFPGYASIAVLITFLSGVQLLTIGILGEYIGRIFGETKNRPIYFIDEDIGSKKREKPENITPR